MIICHDPRLIVLHVPRTGGISLYEAVRPLGDRVQVLASNGDETHMPWWEAAGRWPGYPMYCVMRSPWEIFASCYRLHQWFGSGGDGVPQITDYLDYFARVGNLPWPAWVREMIATHHLCPPGGFSVRYAGPGVHVLQYTQQPYQRIGDLLGVPLQMPRRNSQGTHPSWSAELVELVGEHCWRDIERFGYRPASLVRH